MGILSDTPEKILLALHPKSPYTSNFLTDFFLLLSWRQKKQFFSGAIQSSFTICFVSVASDTYSFRVLHSIPSISNKDVSLYGCVSGWG